MLTKILKFFGKSVKKTTESVGKSMEFIDDVLEKEYITSTVDNIKESTGKAAEKAGETYQKTKNIIDEKVNKENLKTQVDKAVNEGKKLTERMSEQMLENSETLKNVMQEGADIVKGFFEEE